MSKRGRLIIAISGLLLVAIIAVAVILLMMPEEYTVSLDANGGSVSSTQVVVTYGDEYSLPIPKRDGYVFHGWFRDGERVYETGMSWDIGENITLVAKWAIVNGNGLYFDEVDGGYALVDYTGSASSEVIIPATHNGKPVKSIADGAFDRLKTYYASMGDISVSFYFPSGVEYNPESIDIGKMLRVSEYDFLSDSYILKNDNDGLSVVGYRGDLKSSIFVPLTYNDLPIKRVESGTFDGLKNRSGFSKIAAFTFYLPSGVVHGVDSTVLNKDIKVVEYDYISERYVFKDKVDYLSVVGYLGEFNSTIFVPYTFNSIPVKEIEGNIFEELKTNINYSKVTAFSFYFPNGSKYDVQSFDMGKETHIADYDAVEDNFVYKNKGSYWSVVGYIGDFSEDVIVPMEYEEKAVKELGAYLFWNSTLKVDHESASFSRVMLHNQITLVDKFAFTRAGGLKVSLYESTGENTIREIIELSKLFDWTKQVVIKEGNDQLIDVVTLIRPAFGWSAYTGAKYYVRFDANGGKVNVYDMEIKRNKAYELPVPTMDGYSFEGWYYNGELIAQSGETWKYTTHMELTAKWTDNKKEGE